MIQENFAELTNSLNYIKFSYIILCAKMFRYSHYIHIADKKYQNIWINCLEVSKHLGPKKL